MRLLRRGFVVSAALLAGVAPGLADEHRVAVISGAQVAPPNASPAVACGTFVIDTAANTVAYRIVVSGLTAAETAAHIHGFADPGINAGVLHALPAGPVKIGTWNYAEAQEPEILKGRTYVNIHTAAFPGGEVRGQITDMYTGIDEAQVTAPTGSGSTGWGVFSIDTVNDTLTYHIVHNLAAETAAHIHGTVAHGANAGVLHALPAGSPKIGSWNYPAALEADLLRGMAYVNIHSAAFPGGEIRGQVSPIIEPIDGTQVTVPTGSPAAGCALISIDLANDVLGYDIRQTGLVAAETAAHIHGYAPPGANAGVLNSVGVGARKLGVWNYPAANEANILDGLTYINIHSAAFPGGEIRGQVEFRPLPCPGDANCDGMINITDLGIILGAFGSSFGDTSYSYGADINKDGTINITDLGGLLAVFGTPCP